MAGFIAFTLFVIWVMGITEPYNTPDRLARRSASDLVFVYKLPRENQIKIETRLYLLFAGIKWFWFPIALLFINLPEV